MSNSNTRRINFIHRWQLIASFRLIGQQYGCLYFSLFEIEIVFFLFFEGKILSFCQIDLVFFHFLRGRFCLFRLVFLTFAKAKKTKSSPQKVKKDRSIWQKDKIFPSKNIKKTISISKSDIKWEEIKNLWLRELEDYLGILLHASLIDSAKLLPKW